MLSRLKYFKSIFKIILNQLLKTHCIAYDQSYFIRKCQN